MSPAKVTLQRQASSLTVAARRPHLPTPSAYPQTETMTMLKIKVILISLATLVALDLSTAAAVKLLSGTSSEEIEVVEPGRELHQGPKLFDFSNMKVAGSSTLIILRTLAALSFFCRRRIISKLSWNQAPFVPSHPAAAAPSPAAAYNQATGLALLPDINYQTVPQPFRGQVQDFCSFPQLQHASRLTPSFAPPSSKVPSSGDLDRLRLGLGLPPSYYLTALLPLLQRGHGHGGRHAQPGPECSQSRPGPVPPNSRTVAEGGTCGNGRRRRGDGGILVYSRKILANFATKGVGLFDLT